LYGPHIIPAVANWQPRAWATRTVYNRGMSRVAARVNPVAAQSMGQWIAAHWLPVFLVAYGLWVWLPWLAPILMESGSSTAAQIIYSAYSVFCHQLPERSFFLSGPQTMYSLSDIQVVWQDALNPMTLRKFIGNDAMGWKVAWSDRMVSFYTSIWLLTLAWLPFRRRIKPLAWWGFGLLLLPMLLDGVTHTVSDFSGLGRGFRDSNAWLISLMPNAQQMFLAGDALGSFNSWARLITGVLAGLGIVWFALPHLERSFGPE
jgi:uncharacterized membrane protein